MKQIQCIDTAVTDRKMRPKTKRRTAAVVLGTCLILISLIHRRPPISTNHQFPNIDLVITYVNGSDPDWFKAYEKAIADSNGTALEKSTDVNRFRDNDELRFLLRSVDRFGSIFRRVFLVVASASQVPCWLNGSNTRLGIVYHNELFGDSPLPSFNSIAIESALHRIRDLSEVFVYANDDFTFVDEVRFEDFIPEFDLQPVFLGRAIRFYTNSEVRLKNISRDFTWPQQAHWLNSALNSRDLIRSLIKEGFCTKQTDILGLDNWIEHAPRVFLKSVLESAERILPEVRRALEKTRRARFRSRTDIQIGHFFPAFIQCTDQMRVLKGPQLHLGYVADDLGMEYFEFIPRAYELNELKRRATSRSYRALLSLWGVPPLKYLCTNDETESNEKNTTWGLVFRHRITDLRLLLFPVKSSFEL